MDEQEKTYWALDLSIDLYDCCLEKFNELDIKSFGQRLGQLVDPEREVMGVVTDFGEGEALMEGFRLIHETYSSLITAHFVRSSQKGYINIHSCNPYRPSEAIELCGDYFDTTRYACKKNMRR